MINFGKAELGDKTMVDVLVPFDDASPRPLRSAATLRPPGRQAAQAADKAAAGHRRPAPADGPGPTAGREEPRHPRRRARTSLALIVNAIGAALFARPLARPEANLHRNDPDMT